jgi:integrase
MRGNITRRGRESWRLRFDVGVDANGKRKVQSVTVRGTKRRAQAKLSELLTAVDKGTFVEVSRVTIAEHVRARVTQWEASGEITGRTAERYRELVENQIVPHLGARRLQALKTVDIEQWHTILRTKGRKGGGALAARTIASAHRVLSKTLREAVKHDMLVRNVAGRDGQRAPKIQAEEIEILPADKIDAVIEALRGRTMYAVVIVALFTGMRRGELLALRWANVDLIAKEIRIRESLERIRQLGFRFKAPKTKAGRRDVTLPDIVIGALADHRRRQLEQRVAMGAGKLPADALVFSAPNGSPRSPDNLSRDWAECAAAIGLPGVTFHALRHTHASQLIDAGVDVVRISKRLGHASPNVTLTTDAHLFHKRDNLSADAINAALARPDVTRS